MLVTGSIAQSTNSFELSVVGMMGEPSKDWWFTSIWNPRC